jgi:hypothetical protein
VCNCNSKYERNASDFDECVSSVMNSDKKETEEETLSNATAKWHKLGKYCYWLTEKGSNDSYNPIKIQFFQNS